MASHGRYTLGMLRWAADSDAKVMCTT